jgi:hypothetical protein
MSRTMKTPPLDGETRPYNIRFGLVTANCGFVYYRCSYCICWFFKLKHLKSHLQNHVVMNTIVLDIFMDKENLPWQSRFTTMRGKPFSESDMRKFLNRYRRAANDNSNTINFFTVKIEGRPSRTKTYFCTFCGIETVCKGMQTEHVFRAHVKLQKVMEKAKMYCL